MLRYHMTGASDMPLTGTTLGTVSLILCALISVDLVLVATPYQRPCVSRVASFCCLAGSPLAPEAGARGWPDNVHSHALAHVASSCLSLKYNLRSSVVKMIRSNVSERYCRSFDGPDFLDGVQPGLALGVCVASL